jgi:hypothetical protein
MPGLVPGIHVLEGGGKGVDGRDKPGHDSYWHGLVSRISSVDMVPEMEKSP